MIGMDITKCSSASIQQISDRKESYWDDFPELAGTNIQPGSPEHTILKFGLRDNPAPVIDMPHSHDTQNLPSQSIATVSNEYETHAEIVAPGIYAETHRSEERGGYLVTAKDETTDILYSAFVAAAKGLGEKYQVGELKIAVSAMKTATLGDFEASVLYSLLRVGVRTGGYVIEVTPRALLDDMGYTNQSSGRAKILKSLKDLIGARVYVEAPGRKFAAFAFSFLSAAGEQTTRNVAVAIEPTCLALFASRGYPLEIDCRRKLAGKKYSTRVYDYLNKFSAFQDGQKIKIPREKLLSETGISWDRLSKSSFLSELIKDLSVIGILVQKDLSNKWYFFQKINQ